MRKIIAIGLIALLAISSLGAVSADKGNKLDYVNVGKWHTGYNYHYEVTFFDSEKKEIEVGNAAEHGAYYDRHIRIPDAAAYYKVGMKAYIAGNKWGYTGYIPATYVSTGQKNTITGQTYKNTGIFTIKGLSTQPRIEYALESDVGRVIDGWKKADGESGIIDCN